MGRVEKPIPVFASSNSALPSTEQKLGSDAPNSVTYRRYSIKHFQTDNSKIENVKVVFFLEKKKPWAKEESMCCKNGLLLSMVGIFQRIFSFYAEISWMFSTPRECASLEYDLELPYMPFKTTYPPHTPYFLISFNQDTLSPSHRSKQLQNG